MEGLFNSAFTGIFLCISTYVFGVWVNKKTNSTLLNPFLVSTVLSIGAVLLFDISLEQFNRGASILNFFLAPAVCALGLSIYRQRKILGEYFIPVVAGCLTSAIVSVWGTFLLAPFFGLDEAMTGSMTTGRITTAIAVDIVENLGGIVPIAVSIIVFTGIFGAIVAPFIFKIFRITNEIEVGVSIGVGAHVAGAAKATEFGEIQAALAGVAIGVAGLSTLLVSLFF